MVKPIIKFLIKAYLWVFVYWEKTNKSKLIFMVQFISYNAKNANTYYISSEFHYKNYSHVFFQKKVNLLLKIQLSNKLDQEF